MAFNELNPKTTLSLRELRKGLGLRVKGLRELRVLFDNYIATSVIEPFSC